MRILVGISGGVDSAYAAKLLLDRGNEVEGAVLIMHEHTELDAAREAAESIGIKLHEIDCTRSFESIKDNFVNEYVAGKTPNPCIICNERVKFSGLYDFAMENGFDAIATGHYASVQAMENGEECLYALSLPEDLRKEQTYMLYRLPQKILSRLILPLSKGTKGNIREIASEQGISAANRSDSQEICFLPEGNYTEYIESCVGKCPEGNFVDEEGNFIGIHKGIIHYTVGQRKGLGISLGERAFVTKIDPISNEIVLSTKFIGDTTVRVTDMVFSGMKRPDTDLTLTLDVKIRYTAPLVKTVAHIHPDGSCELVFDSPVRSAPGQSAVLYKNGVVMCGGFIE